VVLFVIALTLLVVTGAALSSLGLGAVAGTGARSRWWGTLLFIALPELLGLVVPALGFVAWHKQLSVLRGLLRGEAGQVVAGLLLGLGLFYFLAAWIEPWYEQLVRLSPSEQRALQRMIAPPSGLRPLGLDLLTFALVPALCEELLFRGAMLGSLLAAQQESAPREPELPSQPWTRSPAFPVLLSALLFGMIHLSWGRLLPTTLLGLGFALAVRRSGSLWPAIAMHAVNNTLVVLMVRHGTLSFAAFGGVTRLALLPVAVLCTVLGIHLLRRRSPQ
jgi:membrane protease YdiL (CAAX protease family)